MYANSDFNVAVHALVYLSYSNRALSSEELAEDINTSPTRVRKVMAKLARKGLVESSRGSTGRYSIARKSDLILLDEVALATETRFVYTSWRSGGSGARSLTSSYMASVIEELYVELDRLCIERLHEKTIRDLEQYLVECSIKQSTAKPRLDNLEPEE